MKKELSFKNFKHYFIGSLKPSGFFAAVGLMAFVTVLALGFRRVGITQANIIMLFIIGVLLVSIQSDGYLYGIIASVLGVLSFNFFFLEPLYTFQIHNAEYIVTFVIMLIVALITSTLTSKLKQEAELAQFREKRNEFLFTVSRNLLTTRNLDQIIATTAVNIATFCGSEVILYMAGDDSMLMEPYIYAPNGQNDLRDILSEKERKIAQDIFEGKNAVSDKVYYAHISGRNKTLGLIGVHFPPSRILHEQKVLIDSIAVQIAITIERENYSKKQQESHLEMEGERLRSNLLRAVSHDLKTPLAGIVGSASAILENWPEIEEESKKSLLSGIFEDAQWLSNSVDNILSITRIEDGRVTIRKTAEAAEEIIGEAVQRAKRYAGNRTIRAKIPDSLLLVPMDGRLIEQVLVNLLDNAIKYTPDGSTIDVMLSSDSRNAVFTVSDNGYGIGEKDLPFVFDRFYTTDTAGSQSHKGIGLGLAICKSIVIAHQGTITASNRAGGGAVFEFTLPLEG